MLTWRHYEIKNNFDMGPDGWSSYDYHWSIVAKGSNIFILTTWERTGGVDDGGYVWADESRWSADTPESPVSILPNAQPQGLERRRHDRSAGSQGYPPTCAATISS
ncbi:MAG: hypothetical protein OTJ97_07775 [SAR202 cluster bacterium]|nr:hypothetical protein [SAR202 cluster bacterium]